MGCVKTSDRATAMVANGIPALFAKALFSGDRMTNPESQNTGILVT